MTPSEYKDFFKDLATSHRALRHNEENEEYPDGFRKSFFWNDEEFNQGQLSQANSPAMLLPKLNGKLRTSDMMEVYNDHFGAFEILVHTKGAQDFEGVNEAEGQAYAIAEDIIAKIMDLCERIGYAGPIHNFDANSVRFEYISRDVWYGVRFVFDFTILAFNTTDIDLSEKFS